MSTSLEITNIINEGASPVVLTGPHNGWHVPDEFISESLPLGVEPYWFDPHAENHRHEACDWGMQPLFEEIAARNTDICLLGASVSRLVVDLNRIPSIMVYETSSETGEAIPGNMNLSSDELERRLYTYYAPYHAELDRVLQITKEKYGQVIWLDMHSFTPVWQGKKRPVGIGTLKMERNDFTLGTEKILEDTFGELFCADDPYDLSLSPYREINAGGVAAERNDVDYFGIEIRNDLLIGDTQIRTMADQIIKLIGKLS